MINSKEERNFLKRNAVLSFIINVHRREVEV